MPKNETNSAVLLLAAQVRALAGAVRDFAKTTSEAGTLAGIREDAYALYRMAATVEAGAEKIASGGGGK